MPVASAHNQGICLNHSALNKKPLSSDSRNFHHHPMFKNIKDLGDIGCAPVT